MNDSLHKLVLAGVGMAALSRDKAKELAEKVVKELDVSEAEAKKYVEEMIKSAEETTERVSGQVKKTVTDALEKINPPSRAEYEALQKKVHDLEKKLKEAGK